MYDRQRMINDIANGIIKGRIVGSNEQAKIIMLALDTFSEDETLHVKSIRKMVERSAELYELEMLRKLQ